MADGAAAAPCADPDIGTQEPRQRRTRGPSLDKTAQTRQQIAEAALAEFVECGVARSTMELFDRKVFWLVGPQVIGWIAGFIASQGFMRNVLGYVI